MRALGIVIVAIAAPAAAAPGDDPATGREVFTGAVSSDATSLVGNPAALDLGREGLHLWVGGLAAIDQYAITLQQESASGAFTDGPAVKDVVTTTGWQAAVYEVKSDFAAGAIINIPPPDEFIADRDALRYHTLGGRVLEKTYAAVGGSIRIAEGLFVGGSASYTGTVIDLAFARDTALENGRSDANATGLENPSADEIVRIHADKEDRGFNRIAFTLGFSWQITPKIAVGAFYREPQGFNGDITTSGTVDVTRAPRAGGDATGGLSVVSFVPAQTLELGARAELVTGLHAIGGLRWEATSRTQQLDVRMFGAGLTGFPEWYPRPRGFRDTWSGWAGVEQVDDGQRLVVGARLGLSSGAVAQQRISPMQVEGWNASGALGAQIRLANEVSLVANYDVRWYIPQDVAPSAYDPIERLDCIDSNYDLSSDACQAVRDGYGIDTAAGSYARWQHVLRVGVRIDWE
ncbi:MAG TPA: hypothetical protein VL463_07720 [Kofleriaceae bacterium]|jgi:hypothetical protein|nr:hypothetical protein [Kofleriaceae bacterium]